MIKKFLLELWRDESGGSAGRLAFTLAGAALGSIVGLPQLGAIVGSFVGALVFPQELPDQEGARLDPNNLTTASYGDPIPIGYGNFIVGGIMAYYPGFVEHRIETEVDGKSTSTQKVISYTYTGSFRVNACEGPVDSIMKIWMNRKLVYDASTSTAPFLDYEKINEAPGNQSLRIYLGGEDQLPDPTEQADIGVDGTPGYRGLAGVMFENWPLDDTGGVPPQITMLISSVTIETLSAESFDASLNGAQWAELNGFDRIAFRAGTLWDNAAQREYGTHPAVQTPEMDFPLFDGQNNWYKFTNTRILTQFDSVTFQSNGAQVQDDPQNGGSWGDNNLWWNEAQAFGGIRTIEGDLVGEKLFIAEVGSGTYAIIDILTYSHGEGGGTMFIGNPGGGVNLSSWIIVDNDRNLWYTDRTNDTLNRINPGDGQVDFTIAAGGGNSMTYDKYTNTIIYINDVSLRKFDVGTEMFTETHTFDGSEAAVPLNGDGKNLSIMRQGVQSDGTMYIQTGAVLGNFSRFDLRDFDAQQAPISYSPGTDFGLGSSTTHRGIFDPTRNAVMKRDDLTGDVSYLYIGRTGGGELIDVKSIVDDVSDRVGLLPADIDTTELTELLHGYIVPRRMAAKNALGPLSRMFFFDPVAEDYQIKFVKSGQASVATIEEDDLGANSGDPRASVDELVEEYVQEIELPEVMELGYNNPETEYQPMWQRTKRPRSTTNTLRQKRIVFPGSFVSNTDAKRRIDTILYNIWTKRRPVTWFTSQRYMRLSPTDVITLTHEGATSNVVVGSVELGVNNVIEFTGAADDPTTLISVSIGAEGDADFDDQTIDIIGPSEFYVLDIPLLKSSDAGFGAYLAAAPFSFGVTFLGTNFIVSTDNVAYGPFGFVNKGRASNHGFASSILAGGVDDGLWDRTNTLSVQMLYGTLASSTEDAVLDGDNALLVGSEIICFVTAVDNGDGKYDLTNLLRGRRGTEGEIGSHITSERVIELSESTTVRAAMDLAALNVALFYKGVTLGANDTSALVKSFTVTGKSEWGWAPVHVFGSITSDDWTVGWLRRSILSPEWKNLFASPGIAIDTWEIDILSGPGGTVVRTITETASANGSVVNLSANTFFYDDADQTTDLGAPVTTLDFIIYPLTDNIGRGFPATIQLIEG